MSKTKDKDVKTEEKLDIKTEWAKMLCSHHIGFEGAKESNKPFKYLMTAKGVKKVMSNAVGFFVSTVPSTEIIPGLPEIEDGFVLQIPKIPYVEFEKTISFFKKVMEQKDDAEAFLQFFYDAENNKYILYCPDQNVAAASVHYLRNQEMEEKYTLVLDIHSHNSMNAFFSSVDDADEKETRFFGVIGKLDTPTPEYKFRVCMSGVYSDIDIFQIFERPFPEMPFPEEWLERCKKAPTPMHVYGKYGKYDYPYGYYGYDYGVYGYDYYEHSIPTTKGKTNGAQVKTFQGVRRFNDIPRLPQTTQTTQANKNKTEPQVAIAGKKRLLEDRELILTCIKDTNFMLSLSADDIATITRELLSTDPQTVAQVIVDEGYQADILGHIEGLI